MWSLLVSVGKHPNTFLCFYSLCIVVDGKKPDTLVIAKKTHLLNFLKNNMYTWTLRRLRSCSPTHFSVSPTSAWRAPVRLWVCSCFSLAFNPTLGGMCVRVGGGIVQKKCSHSVDSQVQNSCRFLKKNKTKNKPTLSFLSQELMCLSWSDPLRWEQEEARLCCALVCSCSSTR